MCVSVCVCRGYAHINVCESVCGCVVCVEPSRYKYSAHELTGICGSLISAQRSARESPSESVGEFN